MDTVVCVHATLENSFMNRHQMTDLGRMQINQETQTNESSKWEASTGCRAEASSQEDLSYWIH